MKSLMALILAVVSVISVTSVGLLLLAIDSIVNGTLYSYGLQFSPIWANPYWLIIRVCFSLLIVVALSTIGLYIINRSAD